MMRQWLRVPMDESRGLTSASQEHKRLVPNGFYGKTILRLQININTISISKTRHRRAHKVKSKLIAKWGR
jgi:hypothetical protein